MHGTTGGAIQVIRSISCALAASYGTAAIAYDPVDCLNDIAKVDSGIMVGLATKLCPGAWTPEPVKCYLGASKADEGISRGIAIDLCAGAVNAESTLACYVRAGTERKLNRGLATSPLWCKDVRKAAVANALCPSPVPGRSILITSAPRSASVCVHQGPASTRERSRMRMPSREFMGAFCLAC